MKKDIIIFVGMVLALALLMNSVSAGVGLKWEQESVLINEGEKTCLIYSVYNPWPEESYVQIESSESLKSVLTLQEAETKLVPANTASKDAIPVKFCFKVPKTYKEDCMLINKFLCKQECNEEQREYAGDVSVKSVPPPTVISGSGGSATTMEVSAPLKLRIRCNPHSRNFSLIYIILGIIALTAIIIITYRKYRKPESERKKERLEKLKREMKILKEKK